MQKRTGAICFIGIARSKAELGRGTFKIKVKDFNAKISPAK